MSSWSRQRKTLYGAIVVVALLILVALPAWKLFYKAPTCFDGIKNGKEQGVDCGGSCQKLCQSQFLSPIINWSRFEELAPGYYNVATYVENPNIDVEANDVPYVVQLYDNRGVLITEFRDTLDIPPHRNTLAFRSAINVQQRVPTKVLFEFEAAPNWRKRDDPLKNLVIANKDYQESGSNSSLTVTMRNNGVLPIGEMSVYVVLYDTTGNTIGFSKTIVDGIDAGGTITAPFTWPINRQGKVVSIEVLPVAK